MKIYLAGPMRGIAQFNFPAFNAAAKVLRAQGHYVFNPAEYDVAEYGADIAAGNLSGDETQASKTHGFSLRRALLADLTFICQEAEAIALLPGWMQSRGALAEHAVAVALGLTEIRIGPANAPLD